MLVLIGVVGCARVEVGERVIAPVVVDRCVATPTAPGCPLADRDVDGIVDREDGCPDLIGEATACVAIDCDGDGVGEHVGACPDQDWDGVPDHEDACSWVAENYNGYEDNDGCPDIVPTCTMGAITHESIWIRFVGRRIADGQRGQLARAAEILCEHPLRVVVSGHADRSEGRTAAVLEGIGLRRAEVVRERLIALGVPAERIEVRSLGATDPQDPGRTAAGRAFNRRVEFRVYELDQR